MFDTSAEAACADMPDCHDLAILTQADPAATARTGLQSEHAGLQLPRWIWRAMALCYAAFFAGLLAAAGHDAEARFALVVSFLYALVYFGVGSLLFRLKPADRQTPAWTRQAPLETATGPMDARSVAGQVLAIPACIALFGLGCALVRTLIL